ncbi:MAG: hypothetical protein ACYDIC_16280 [Desulfobaccales bacterium]
MFLHCPRVQALFPQEKIFLEHDGPAWMLWTEHGGTLILRVGDLRFREAVATAKESGLFLEMDLLPADNIIHKIEGFAAQHNLPLTAMAPPEHEFSARPVLAACHIPEHKKFIFAEESRLQVRPRPGGAVEMEVRGAFRARVVPCQEADLVVHLTPGDLARLLSYLRAVAREG